MKEFEREASMLLYDIFQFIFSFSSIYLFDFHRSLRHPNIVQFLGIFTSIEGERYIVTEFLSKGSLDQLLQNERKDLDVIDLLGMYVDIID